MRPARVIGVAADWTIVDGLAATDHVTATPDDAFADGLPGLLDRVSRRVAGEGSILLAADATRLLGLPPTPPRNGATHPVAAQARAAGWTVSELAPWTTYHATDRPAIHVGILSWIKPSRFPLGAPTMLDTVGRLSRWHQITGCAYHGTPGVAGTAYLKRIHAGKGRHEPTWRPAYKDTPPEGWRHCERDYTARSWDSIPLVPAPYLHGYDANLMYLAALGSLEIARYSLRRHGAARTRTPGEAGFWRVQLAPWQLGASYPDPAGYAPVDGDGCRWVTGPTLDLIDELVAQGGVHGGYTIRASWTAGAARGILRPFAEGLRDMLTLFHNPDATTHSVWADAGEPDAFNTTVRAVYKQTWGMLGREGGLIDRPDWHYATIALARSNLWRKIWAAGQRPPRGQGRTPLYVETDCVWYDSHSERHRDDPVRMFTLSEPPHITLGEFKPTVKEHAHVVHHS